MLAVINRQIKPTGRSGEKDTHSSFQTDDLSGRLFEKFERYQSGTGLAGANVLIISEAPETLQALAAGQGANTLWAPDLAHADMRLAVAISRPHYILLELPASTDTVQLTETYNRFLKKHPDILIVLMSKKLLQDELDKSRPAFCDAALALPVTSERLHAAALAAQKNRATKPQK